jgi:O-antigen/teichoic acid export membrane protein
MKNRIQNLLKIDLVRHNLIFFVGTLAIAVFNYLYYPIVGRLVTVSDFGEIQEII